MDSCFSIVDSIWDGFLSAYDISTDHFSIQSVNQKVFEKILLHEFSQCADPAAPNSTVSTSIDTLSEDELNELQYACGYVSQHFTQEVSEKVRV